MGVDVSFDEEPPFNSDTKLNTQEVLLLEEMADRCSVPQEVLVTRILTSRDVLEKVLQTPKHAVGVLSRVTRMDILDHIVPVIQRVVDRVAADVVGECSVLEQYERALGPIRDITRFIRLCRVYGGPQELDKHVRYPYWLQMIVADNTDTTGNYCVTTELLYISVVMVRSATVDSDMPVAPSWYYIPDVLKRVRAAGTVPTIIEWNRIAHNMSLSAAIPEPVVVQDVEAAVVDPVRMGRPAHHKTTTTVLYVDVYGKQLHEEGGVMDALAAASQWRRLIKSTLDDRAIQGDVGEWNKALQ